MMSALEARDGMLLFGVGAAYISLVSKPTGRSCPSSLGEDLVFSRADGVIAGRLALKKLTGSPDALDNSEIDYVR
jgi:hypothetical protein